MPTPTVTPSPEQMDKSLFTGIPCAALCWHGLEVGKSTEKDAIAVLPSLAFIDQKSVQIYRIPSMPDYYVKLYGPGVDFARYLHGQSTDNMLELRYPDRRRVHNLKCYTWVEQQGRTYAEIQDQWYEPTYWTDVQKQADEIDELIVEFNKEVGIA